MSYGVRLACFVLASLVLHLLLARGMERLPPRRQRGRPAILQVQLREPPPAPAPEPAAEPDSPSEPLERPVHHPLARHPAHLPRVSAKTPRTEEPPATERPATTGDTTNTPVFGLSMESTSQVGGGPSMPVGNTLQTKPTRVAAKGGLPKPIGAPPVPVDEVTKMPLPQGRCSGKYTDQARQAGIEGTVILDLVVGEDGRTREIRVVQGLGQGLTQAAVAALEGCRFSPGERGGKPVAVRLRGFKVRFVLQGAD